MKKITYDPDADAAYIRLRDSKIIDSETIGEGVICDYDENEQIVGIEILSVKKRTPEEIKTINIPLTTEDKQQLKNLLNLFNYVAS
ncbi:DUF2283 domain-containing protein [Crocosphaera chwakensis]|uniref:DUF2283 domain-containing protein n=1 Tax=Crocosphaera chwakensis CCY0110 TaxID=391612 RepID=A3IKB5_9CHRO|nr:DUF2283 domain-containing protein [Crocosphaera chwakensis]EAZ93104.1 hypothetical protein CY0110_03509 [Crocosphaera chwakensis CCY0110]